MIEGTGQVPATNRGNEMSDDLIQTVWASWGEAYRVWYEERGQYGAMYTEFQFI